MPVPAGLEAIYAFVSHLELHIKNNFEEFIHSLPLPPFFLIC